MSTHNPSPLRYPSLNRHSERSAHKLRSCHPERSEGSRRSSPPHNLSALSPTNLLTVACSSRILLLLVLLGFTPMLNAAPPAHGVAVTVNAAAHRVDIAIDGAPFTSYLWHTNQRKPILYPLIAPTAPRSPAAIRPCPANAPTIPTTPASGSTTPTSTVSTSGTTPTPSSPRRAPDTAPSTTTVLSPAAAAPPPANSSPNPPGTPPPTSLRPAVTSSAHPPPDHALRLLQAHHRRQARTRHRHDRHPQRPRNLRLSRRQGRPARHSHRPLPRIRHAKPETLRDANGIATPVAAPTVGATGVYRTSEGKVGDAAWGTRGKWCELSATTPDGKAETIAVLDQLRKPQLPNLLARP